MPPARLPFRFWLVGLALSFFLAGVILRISAASEFAIISPPPDSLLTGQSVTLQFSLPPSLKLVDYQTHPRAAYGQGHLLLWIDSVPDPATAIPVITDTYTLTNLKYGPHQITAELVTNASASLIPKTTATLSFTTVPPAASPQLLQSVLTLSLLSIISICAALALISRYRHLLLPAKTSRRFRSK